MRAGASHLSHFCKGAERHRQSKEDHTKYCDMMIRVKLLRTEHAFIEIAYKASLPSNTTQLD